MERSAHPRPTEVIDRLTIDPTAYIFPHVYMSGTVTIGAHSTVLPMSVLRGDECSITIGSYCNVQDGSIIHGDPGYDVVLGTRVTLGHGAIVHGAVLEDEVLIGMGAVVLNGARIGRGSVVGARALVTEGMQVPPGSLVLGIPGQVRPIKPEQAQIIGRAADEYARIKELYRQRDAAQQGS